MTDAIGEYNTMLAQVDEKSNEIDTLIEQMTDLATRALKGAEFKFGGNNNEFEMIGGTRKSDRVPPDPQKRRRREVKPISDFGFRISDFGFRISDFSG